MRAVTVVGAFAGCGAVGGLVGATELLHRYRDSHRELLRAWALWLYTGVNAAAAMLVLAVARANDWTFGLPLDKQPAQVLGAAVSAMAVLRAGLGVFRFGEHHVPAGPGALLVAMQSIGERNIDRRQAERRSARSRVLMTGVSFAKAHVALSEHCLLALQSAGREETQELAATIAKIAKNDASADQSKAFNLGLALINFAGPGVVTEAVRTLGDEIRA